MGLTSRATWAGLPRSWAVGRLAGDRRAPAYIVIHVTDGSEGPRAAEAGAAYDKVRADSVSTHLFVDSDSAVREVHDADTAYAAYPKGNALGIQVEICGSAAQTVAQWHDTISVETLRLAAYEVAVLCQDHGLPVRHLTVAECRAAWYSPGPNTLGIVSHHDVTLAYPEDGGTHTDPGPSFPWVEFLAMVRGYLAQTPVPTPTQGDDDMIRYHFDSTWTDRPATLADRYVCTDGLGVWSVEPYSTPQASRPNVVTLSKASVAGGKWTFAQTFAAVTGDASWSDELRGMAAWRAAGVAILPGGVPDHAHAVTGSVSGSVSGTVSGTTGPVIPTP